MVRIRMKVVKITSNYTGFKAEDDTALDRPVYFTTKWLAGHGIGDDIEVIVRNAGENEPVTSESDEGSFSAVYHSPDDVFDALLDTVVVPDPDGLLTTYDVWVQWATQHGADPGLTEIAGIKRGGIARRIRRRFSLPEASRWEWFDGHRRRYWAGYAVKS